MRLAARSAESSAMGRNFSTNGRMVEDGEGRWSNLHRPPPTSTNLPRPAYYKECPPRASSCRPNTIPTPSSGRCTNAGSRAACSPHGVDSPKTPYVIVIPPPNVTAVLHMGQGLNNVTQDVLIRFERMRGREALWLPGTD